MTAYAELLRALIPARRFGVVLGLERMRAILDRLGRPDERLGTVIHVGGTNGKGSTVAMLAALARTAGRRVATYTSPHLTSLRERIQFDGELIGEAAMVAAAARVRAAGGDELTFFEQITAIAIVAIAEVGVDVTVLEVGLGGRLDATNVVAAPIAVVTGVAMDHEAVLGDTLAAIAAEKAGIFKRGQHVVIGASGEAAAVPILEAAARAAGASTIDLVGDGEGPEVSLIGAHQRRNAAAAVAAWARVGVPCDVAAALRAVVHPGRFEVFERFILDGAHNPHGAAALAATLAVRGVRPTLVLGVSADKDVEALVRALAPVVTHVIATRYQQERAMAPEALAAIVARLGLAVEIAPDLASAIALTTGETLIAGSLFLVGEARALLCGAPTDPIYVTDPAARNLRV